VPIAVAAAAAVGHFANVNRATTNVVKVLTIHLTIKLKRGSPQVIGSR
jgi:hypothetical protein